MASRSLQQAVMPEKTKKASNFDLDQERKYQHLPSIDSMRGIFALMIVLLHIPLNWSMLHNPIIRNGFVGVDFFFVLSGFVLAFSYSQRNWNSQEFINFIARRFGRLWPLHAFVLTLFMFFEMAKSYAIKSGYGTGIDSFFDSSNFWVVFLQDLSLSNGIRNEVSMELNFPAWSIGAEIWAYAAFSILLFLNQWLRFLATLLIMLFCFGVLSGQIEPSFGRAANWGIFRAISLFLLGFLVLVAFNASRMRSLAIPLPSLAEFVIVAAIFGGIWFKSRLDIVDFYLPILFAIAIFVIGHQSGVVSRVLSNRIFVEIGKRSYSIYLIHVLFLSVLGSTTRALERVLDLNLHYMGQVGESQVAILDLGNSFINNFFVAVILIVIIWLSGLTYRYVEMPGQRFFKRITT